MATSLNHHLRKCMLEPRNLRLIQLRTHKFKTKNPRPKPMPRRVFEEIIKPIYPEKPRPFLRGSCLDPDVNAGEEPNPYEEFLIRQLDKRIWSSELIIISHILPVSRLLLSELKKDYFPDEIKIEPLNNTHMRDIIKDTKLANLEPLLIENNLLMTCKEPKVAELLKPLKRYPQVVVLGGYVGGKLVTQQQLKDLAKLPPLEVALGELVSILNMAAGGKTLSLLNSHQQTLSSSLEQYRKQLGESEEK